MQKRLRLMLWPALLLALFIAACGTKNAGVTGPNLSVPQQSSHEVAGVTAGGFEVVRQNQHGDNDSALNGTISLALQDQGNEKALVINVKDSTFTNAVTLDVRYDASKYHPVKTDFTHLLGQPDQVLQDSVLDTVSGTAGLGMVAIGDYKPAPLSGQFATLYFAPGPDRAVSNVAGDAHENPLGVADVLTNVSLNNLTAVTTGTPVDSVAVQWTAAWMLGNGDGNKEVNLADLTPIGKYFHHSTDTDFGAVQGDYDRNKEANLADLSTIGKYFKRLTDSYLVQVSDDDGAGAVTVATLNGAAPDQSPAKAPVVTGDLTTVFPYWTVTIDTASTPINLTQLAALDANADGNVKMTITPQGLPGKANGVAASITIAVAGGPPPPPTPNELIIQGMSVQVNDGAGTPNELAVLNENNPSFSLVANTNVGFKVKTIKGTFNGRAFDGGPAPPVDPNDIKNTDMTQADYDAAFNAAVANTIWGISSGGDAAARRSSDWVTFASGSTPYLGPLPGGGKIFPDYDPESGVTPPPPDPEGLMTVTLPMNGDALPGGGTASYPDLTTPDPGLKVKIVGQPIVDTFHFDVTDNADQVRLTPYQDAVGGALTSLTLNRRNEVYMNAFAWGARIPIVPTPPPPALPDSPAPKPADYTTLSMQFCRLAADGTLSAAPLDLTYVKFDPGASPPVTVDKIAPGHFTIIDGLPDPNTGEDTFIAVAIIGGSSIVQGASYALRMKKNGEWSSINVPTDLMSTQPPPPPQALEVAPALCLDENDQIQIFYDNGMIRRSSDVSTTFAGNPPTPQFVPVNQAGFDDVLRSGDTNNHHFEFVPSIDPANFPPNPNKDYYPRVVIKKHDSANPISGLDDPTQELGPSVLVRGAGRLVVDVATLTFGQGFGDSATVYDLEVFDQGGVPLGTGTFTYDNNQAFLPSPDLLQFGINVFNREDRDMADRSYDEATNPDVHTVDGTNLKNPAFDVPVIFFEWYGGQIYDYQQNEEDSSLSTPGGNNNYIICTAQSSNRPMYMSMGLRQTLVGPDGTFLAIHTVTLRDFINSGFPNWPGNFDPGENYKMELFDQRTNLAYPFLAAGGLPQLLHVTGTNPNTL